MPKTSLLGQFEQMVLLSLLQLGEQAHAISIRKFLADEANHRVTRGALYRTLDRLEAKGYLRSRLRGRVKLYSPRVPADQVIRETVEDFMGRVFDGEALSLMQHLIHEQGIGSREIRALREMLDRLEGEEDESAKQ